MKKAIILLILCAVIVGLFPGCTAAPQNGYKIAVVPKTISSGWFQRMEKGVNEYNEAHNTDYFYGGSTDVNGQVAYVEQLLAEDWDAICIVPYDTESIAPLLEKAKKEGILIITHEAASMDPVYFDYDVEPFSSEDLGKHYGEVLANKAGGKGTYIQFVGALNSISHNEWCDAADAYLAANTEMVKLGRYETKEDMTSAYNQTKELLQAHPEIVAIQCSASGDLAAVSRAVEELGLSGKVAVIGTSLTSICGEYVTSGTLDSFSLWDPAQSAQAMLALAEKVLTEGDAFNPDTCALTVHGYETMKRVGTVYYGNARTDVTSDNMKDYDF